MSRFSGSAFVSVSEIASLAASNLDFRLGDILNKESEIIQYCNANFCLEFNFLGWTIAFLSIINTDH